MRFCSFELVSANRHLIQVSVTAEESGMTDEAKRTLIRKLNDQFRQTGLGGHMLITRGIQDMGDDFIFKVVDVMRAFDEFSNDNDPCEEHDFGAIEISGHRVFWKIDYYNRSLDGGSEDPSDPTVTTRVLTAMMAHEY